jgi:hypothetical protein
MGMSLVLWSLFVSLNLFQLPSSKQPMRGLVLRIVKLSPPARVAVEISNRSDKPIRIWKDSNSWGAARWRVLLVTDRDLEVFYQNPDQVFTRNIPSFTEIPAGAHIERDLDLNAGNWRGTEGRSITFKPKSVIIVVYDVPKEFGWADAPVTIQAREMHVWYGVVAALAKVP